VIEIMMLRHHLNAAGLPATGAPEGPVFQGRPGIPETAQENTRNPGLLATLHGRLGPSVPGP